MSVMDWHDVMRLAQGLSGIHELEIELTVRVDTVSSNTSLVTTALAWRPTVEPHQVKEIAKVVGTWPAKEHGSYDGFVFSLLYELDKAIGRAYGQEELSK